MNFYPSSSITWSFFNRFITLLTWCWSFKTEYMTDRMFGRLWWATAGNELDWLVPTGLSMQLQGFRFSKRRNLTTLFLGEMLGWQLQRRRDILSTHHLDTGPQKWQLRTRKWLDMDSPTNREHPNPLLIIEPILEVCLLFRPKDDWMDVWRSSQGGHCHLPFLSFQEIQWGWTWSDVPGALHGESRPFAAD